MKGVVFEAFIEMVEQAHGLAVADRVILRGGSTTGGAYASVGTYPAAELGGMVNELARFSERPVGEVLRAFGHALLRHFAEHHEAHFRAAPDLFTFLESVERHIHVDVRKLYEATVLPEFQCERPRANCLRMVYRSPNRLADLAHGLIEGAALHYGQAITISRGDFDDERGHATEFLIELASAS